MAAHANVLGVLETFLHVCLFVSDLYYSSEMVTARVLGEQAERPTTHAGWPLPLVTRRKTLRRTLLPVYAGRALPTCGTDLQLSENSVIPGRPALQAIRW